MARALSAALERLRISAQEQRDDDLFGDEQFDAEAFGTKRAIRSAKSAKVKTKALKTNFLNSLYYGRNERIVKPDGSMCAAEDVLGWYQITKDYHERYKKPVMHTETNVFDAAEAPVWLHKQWANVLRMRADVVAVLGFTWYSLTDQIDWDTNLAEKNDRVNECGLFDLNRKIRPVGEAYKQIVREFGQITILPHGEIFEITDEPARLKVEI